MIVSEARIAANRRNALLSTGPKTAEGKVRSRANALKHGLCASVCVPESLETINARAAEITNPSGPRTDTRPAWSSTSPSGASASTAASGWNAASATRSA